MYFSCVYTFVLFCFVQIPIVDSELRKAAGENPEEKDLDRPTTTHTVRVTADGTYASESALVPTIVKKDEDV